MVHGLGLMVHDSRLIMTQEERWMAKYEEIMAFMAENHRRPSKFIDEERGMRNWWKHNRKLLKAGKMAPERVEMMGKLVDLWEESKRVNQYQ